MNAGKKRILIVDDDADYLEAVSLFLTAHHFTVLKARTGEEGVKLAKMERPDLILMDIMMGERTEGFFTIQQMRREEELRNVPIFVVSSLCTELPEFPIPPDGGWAAHDLFLPKPLDMAELLEKVRQRVGEAG